MNKDIYLSNSLGGKKEKFTPINPKKVRMYVCGPTVYDDPHIGNARPLVVFDILFKVLKCKYGKSSVLYARNITDVDDKIIKRSSEEGIDSNVLTEKYINHFMNDFEWLKLQPANQYPKATDYIWKMKEIISTLIEKGNAYIEEDGSVYFKINSFKGLCFIFF